MHTEEEARKKWCPFARCGTGMMADAAVMNRMKTDAEPESGWLIAALSPCIAFDCMAWRVADTESGPTLGYCGLAGRPE